VTAGDTFRFADPRLEPHLWIILTDPQRQPSVVVIVSASTKSLGLDLPVIEPGEYRALGQRSWIRCDKARLVSTPLLQQNLDARVIRLSHALAPALLTRVRAAVLASPHTPNEVKAALQI